MHLTEFQKEIIKSIIDHEVNDIESFFRKFCELTEAINQSGTHMSDFGNIRQNMRIFIPRDENATLLKTKEFITLWKALERVDLIFSISSTTRQFNTPIFNNRNMPFKELSDISKEYFFREIVFTPELNKFYKREYLTNLEFEQNQERRDRKESQKLTRKIAYITVSITIIVSALTAIFNYLTYTTDRNVKITNKEAFKDTIIVRVIGISDSLSSKEIPNKLLKEIK